MTSRSTSRMPCLPTTRSRSRRRTSRRSCSGSTWTSRRPRRSPTCRWSASCCRPMRRSRSRISGCWSPPRRSTTELIGTFNGLLLGDVRPLPSGEKLARGPSRSRGCQVRRCPEDLERARVGRQEPAPGTPTPTTTTTTGVTATDDAKWFDLQKTFGPVSFKRVGLRYATGSLWFLLDASLDARRADDLARRPGLRLAAGEVQAGFPARRARHRLQQGSRRDRRIVPHSSWKDPTTNKTVDEYAGSVGLIRTKDLTLSAGGLHGPRGKSVPVHLRGAELPDRRTVFLLCHGPGGGVRLQPSPARPDR